MSLPASERKTTLNVFVSVDADPVEIKAAYDDWWCALTLKGDPARMGNLSWKAFQAGCLVGLNAHFQLRKPHS